LDTRRVPVQDISLETFFRTRVEATDIAALSIDDSLALLDLVLQSHCTSAGCTPEAANAHALLRKLQHDAPAGMDRWSQDWSLHAVAVFDNVAQAVAHVLDGLCSLVQMPADVFGTTVGRVDGKYVANFGEEVARGHPLYTASALLHRLQVDARGAAGLGPWEVISPGPDTGAAAGLVVVAALADLQGEGPQTGIGARVVLSAELGGLEDVPPGVVAVLTASPVRRRRSLAFDFLLGSRRSNCRKPSALKSRHKIASSRLTAHGARAWRQGHACI
jgi:alpha-glucan, water dikinase